jgi:4-hydroxybenzoate polyprenyltransferase
LVTTDTLWELVVFGLFRQPLALLHALPQLLRGRAALKAALAARLPLPLATLPLRADLVDWLRGEAARGREIHLCSAANQALVDAVARRVGIFDSATGSAGVNLKGTAKAELLAKNFPRGFCYVGDCGADLAVWVAAASIGLAGVRPAIAKAARALGKPIEAEFVTAPLRPADCLKALRAHHWSKNGLLFVPLVLGHAWHDPAAIASAVLGFLCLLLATSGTYLVNDLADLDADRRHWSKRNRALASGRLSIPVGFLSAGVSLGAAILAAFLLSLDFALALSAYLALTLGYSFGLKRVPLLDTLIIGILFTSRLVMGITLTTHDYSEWLLIFSLFFFFSMAVAKRHAEIVASGTNPTNSLASRGYQEEDAPLTLVFGAASSIASLLIMALFIVEQVRLRNLYSHPAVLWGIPIVLSVWVGRVWLLAHRGRLTEDPVTYALRDPTSLSLGAAVAAIFLAAL